MENLIVAVTAAILALLPQWNTEKEEKRARDYATIIVEETQAVQPAIDPFLVVAIVFKESSFRAKIKGQRGEVGLMQVMPRGALTRTIIKKADMSDVRTNIRVGVGHLDYWQHKCGVEREDVWLSAYNLGRCKKTKYSRRVRKVYCKIRPGGCGGVS